MFFMRSLRAKTLLYVLIPTVLGLVAVASIALYAYDQVAREVVQQRDAELARLQAARLSEGLLEYAELLQAFAAQRDVRSMNVDRLAAATTRAPEQFKHFDAGVVVFDEAGVAVWSTSPIPRRRGTDYPLPSQFDLVRLAGEPSLSHVFIDPVTGEGLISLAVPVVDPAGQFIGVVAGLQSIGDSPFAQVYADLLQVSPEQSRQAYVVDGNGQVIYHGDASLIGKDLSAWDPVSQATKGESGAILTDDQMAEPVIAGFAPVPDTAWGIVTQENWSDIVAPIRGYINLILGVLIIAGLSTGAMVFLSTGRVLRPIHDLTRGAERIAGGDFDHTISAQTGDEVEILGEQFNLMAAELRESYEDLERRVADRTQELAALNAIAEVASSSLDLDQVLDDTLDKTLEVMDVEAGGIYLLQGEDAQGEERLLTIRSSKGVTPEFVTAIDNLEVGEGFSGRVVQTGEPLVVPDLSRDHRLTRPVVTESGFRTVAIVPLSSRGRIWGSLFVITRSAREFSPQDVEFLSHIADQIAVAIENASLFDAEQRRAEQFRVISEMGRHIASILDIDELLREIIRLLNESFGYYQVTVGLIEGDQLVFTAAAKAGWEDPEFVPPPTTVGGEGITAWVAATGQPLLVPDASKDPRFLFLAESPETKSELAVPMKTKEGVVGVLNVESDELNAFDESDMTLLQSMANQAAIAVENARLYEDTKRRLAQVIALQETTRAVASTLEIDKLLELIIQQATTLLQADGGIINVVDWETNEDEAVAGTGLGGAALGGRAPLDGSLSGWVALHNQPIISNQLQDDPRADLGALLKLVKATKRQIRCGALAPLTIKGQVAGTLVVLDKQGGEGEFDQTDLELLAAFANQAATAMENARLFDGQQRRAEQFRVISEVGRRITSILDVDDLMDEIARLIKESFGYYAVGISLTEGEDLIVEAGSGPPFEDPEFVPPHVTVGGEGITGWVAGTGEAALVPDVSQDPRYVPLSSDAETRSELCVPLRTKEAVIGVLNVESDMLDAFDEGDLVVLQSLANQAAIAIENAQLYEDVRSRLAQVTALQETTKAVASTLELDSLLNLITEEATALLHADGGVLNLVDWEANEDEVVASTGSMAFTRGYRSPLEGSLSGWASLHRQAAVSNQLQEDSRVDLRGLSWVTDQLERPIGNAAVAPLIIKGEVVGTLLVVDRSGDGAQFDQTDLDSLVALANQAAVAIQNADLFDAVQRRAEQFQVLSEVGARITSLLDVDELLHETVRLVNEVLGYYLVAIGLVEGENLVVKVGAGPRWSDSAFQPPRIPIGEGIAGRVAETGQSLLVPDVSQEPRYLLLADSTETKSELAVPLKSKAQVIGVLDVQSDKLNAFDESDLVVLQSLANLTAIALEEARLFDAEQRRAEQFRVISEMGAQITSILTVDELLFQIVGLVRNSLGYYHTAIGLIENDELVIKTGVGAHWDDPEHQPSRLKVGGKGVTAWVAATGEPLLVPDVSQDERYLLLSESEEIRSEVAVPLRTAAGVIGVLDVQSNKLHAFDESDLAVLRSVAHQAAIAIENARLYEQAQQAAALEERSRLARDLHDAVTQTLFSASLIGEIVPAVWESDQLEGKQLLQELRQLTRGALAEMRTLLLELRPAALIDTRLDDLLNQLGEAVTGRSGLPVTVTMEGQCDLPPDVHVAFYRIAQEALNNVVKHAGASEVSVALRSSTLPERTERRTQQVVELLVKDDGRGFDPDYSQPDRLGLGIIRERAESIGASVEIRSEPGSGTEVEVVWPSGA
jgi:GAF domain-containing protein/HAMP domain-containing protein